MPSTAESGGAGPSEAQFKKIAGGLAIAAFIFMGSFLLLVQVDVIKLYPSSSSAETLNTFGEKAEFAFHYQTLLVLWLIFNVFVVIYGRMIHKSINPLETKTEEYIQIYKNTLTNSFETIVISVMAQLVFISFASPTAVLKFIPMVNIIQFIGRIAFLAGYPFYRSFGFLCTIIPSIVLVLYSVFKLGSFIGMY